MTAVRTSFLVLACSVLLGAVIVLAQTPWIWLIPLAAIVATVLVIPASWSPIPWWMHPGWGMILGVVPGAALATLVADDYFLAHWSAPKLFTTHYATLTAVLVLAFVIGVLIGSRLLASSEPAGDFSENRRVVALLERSTRFFFAITIVGYLVWTTLGLARGLSLTTLTQTLAGSSTAFYSARNDFLAPVAGVTTLTQFGPLVATQLMLLRRAGSEIRVMRYLIPLFGLALVRAVLHGERLGIVELLIPIAVIVVALPRSGPSSRRRRAFSALVPLWIPLALLIFFGTFEYFRTWSHTYQYQYGNDGFAAFAVDRLAGYYATAPNNSALLLDQDPGGDAPYYLLDWFWNLPGISSVYPPGNFAGPQAFASALAGQANTEFNNPGGILVPIADVGISGAIVFWLVVGGLVGLAFQMFRRRALPGLLLYPVLFIGLLEAGRVLYWTSGRAVPSIAGAVLVSALVHGAVGRTQLTRASRPTVPLRGGHSSSARAN